MRGTLYHRNSRNHGHGSGLNEEYATEPCKAGNGQEGEDPGDEYFGKVQSVKECTTLPHWRERSRKKQYRDQKKQVQGFSRKVSKTAFRPAHTQKQANDREHSGNFSQRHRMQTRDPVLGAGAVYNIEYRQPEICAFQRL